MKLKLSRNSIVAIMFLIIAFIYSCEYEPTEKFNRNINKNAISPNIQVVKLNLTTDTIYLTADSLVHFIFNSNEQEINSVVFSIDDSAKATINSDSGTFDIQIKTLKKGIHSLQIAIYSTSGTGSIADKIGAEGFVSSKSWVLVVKKFTNANMKTNVINGLLNISWAKYPSYDFTYYYLRKTTQYFNNYVWYSYSRTNTGYIDTAYLGEGGTYELGVNNIGAAASVYGNIWLPDEFQYLVPSFNLRYKSLGSHQYLIEWSKFKYYGAIDSFKLDQIVNSGIQQIVKVTTDPNDTIYNYTGNSNGDLMTFQLKVILKNKKTQNFYPDNIEINFFDNK